MIQIHAHKKQLMLMAALMMVAGGQSAQASGITGEQVVATFSNPILAGVVANDPTAGQNTYFDNTSTAAYNINNVVNNTTYVSSNLNWGTYSEANPNGFLTDSVLVFVGNTIPSNQSDFTVGSLTFLNGTSDLSTLIFGVTMNFYAGSVSTANFLGSDTIVITTTNNIFGVPGGLTSGDDDYVNICGTFSTICGTSIEAVESSEGGQGISVNLTGTIVGDPMLTLTSASVPAGQNSIVNGFLGTDPAVGTLTPEPSNWATTGCVLVLSCLLFRRRLANR